MRQTSIRLSDSAREALSRVCARTGSKVEPKIRQLLQKFIESQRERDEDRRLTHVAVALSRPPNTRLPGDPPPTSRLPMRLSPELQRSAEHYAYRIPGHTVRQGHRDYASRPLSAAVTTAIALEEPFQEPDLVGLPMLVEHRLGDGLWRLVVAASLTGEERRALADRPAPLPGMILDGEVMWHSPERSVLALRIAKNLFTGPDAAEYLSIVAGQEEEFRGLMEQLIDPRVVYGGHVVSDGAESLGGSKEGRAATAIWRGQRILSHEALAAWITSHHSTSTAQLTAPDWRLTMPPGWHAVRFSRTSSPPPALHAAWTQGSVLRIDSGRSSAFWPTTASGAPLPRIEPVLRGSGLTDPVRLAEVLLVTAENGADTTTGLFGPLRVDAEQAYAANLITPEERDDLVAGAAAETTARMDRVVSGLERSHHRSKEILDQLRDAMHSPPQFASLCAVHRINFSIWRPLWVWEIPSISAALAAAPPLSESQLKLLGQEWRRIVDLAVGYVQYDAWTAAMWSYRDREVDLTEP